MAPSGAAPPVPPGPPASPDPSAPVTHVIHGASTVIVQVAAPEKPTSPRPKKAPWDFYLGVQPLLQAALIAGLGFWFTGQVTNAIQKRQLELNNVKEMQGLLAKLYEGGSADQLAATVSALTAFRDYAVPPLVNLMQSSDPIKRTAAETGLRTVALSDSAAVARQLLRVVAARNRLCSWRLLESSVRLLGELGCREALGPLRELRERVSGPSRVAAMQALAAITNPDAPPDTTNTDRLKKVIQTAIARLDPGEKGGTSP